jgi:NADH dehydrogenase [ubiquinone] 1 alpha subcomplex assembly factor 1
MPAGRRTVFDLADPARVAAFAPIDDVVMGGRSSSRVLHQGGRLVFTGEVSLEQGGGFASIRSRPERLGLDGCGGLLLRVRGDGHRYKVNLGHGDAHDGFTWQAPFETSAGAWRTVAIPFADFAPRFRGSPRPEAGPLDPARLGTVGFLVSDRQAGPFRLEVEWVMAWEGMSGPPSDP